MERRDRIRVQIAGQDYNVVGGEFQEMLAVIKQITGRRFASELKVWQLPGTAEDIQRQLDIMGYRLESSGPAAEPARPAGTAQPGGDRIRLLVQGHRLAVLGGSFQEMLSVVKNLPGRRFDAASKMWEVPAEVSLVKGIVEAAGFQLEGAEHIALDPVPPMESPDFLGQQPDDYPPLDFEEPHFSETDLGGFDWPAPGEPMAPPPLFDESYHFNEPPPEPDPPLFTERPARPAPAVSAAGRAAGDRVRIRVGEQPLVVTGGSFQEMLAVIKGIPGRRFNSQDKLWEFPGDIDLESVQQAVRAAGFILKAD